MSLKLEYSAKVVSLLILTIWVGFVCFWNLDSQEISRNDEHMHASIVQQLVLDGFSFPPMHGEKFYVRKPAFNMYLNAAVVSVFGHDNWSYRFLSASFGAATIALCAWAAYCIFNSFWLACLAAGLLSSNYTYFTNHVVRHAVQDSALVFFSTLSIVLCLKEILSDQSQAKWWLRSILAGLACTAAVLSKSAAGLFPLAVLGLVFLLTSLSSRKLHLSLAKNLAVISLLLFSLAPVYALILWMRAPDGLRTMIYKEVIRRVTRGSHNRDHHFFYFDQLFFMHNYSPYQLWILGSIIVIALVLLGLWKKNKLSSPSILLLAWGVLPIFALSAVNSRLAWYLAPSFPGIALVSTMFVKKITDLTFTGNRKHSKIYAVLLLGFLSYVCIPHYFRLSRTILNLSEHSLLDQVSRQMASVTQDNKALVLASRIPTIRPRDNDFHSFESFYIKRFSRQTQMIPNEASLLEKFNAANVEFALFYDSALIDNIRQVFPQSCYVVIPASKFRSRRFTIISKNHLPGWSCS